MNTNNTIEEMVEELYLEMETFSHDNGDRPCLAFYKKNKRTGGEKYMGYSKGYPTENRCTCGAVSTRESVKEEYRKKLTKAKKQGVREERERVWKDIQKLPTIQLTTDDKEMGEFLHSVDLDDIKKALTPQE